MSTYGVIGLGGGNISIVTKSSYRPGNKAVRSNLLRVSGGGHDQGNIIIDYGTMLTYVLCGAFT
ncbi:hypothetical protein H5410_039705 [Solanum commersonii]|uniref:Uncharacterized protein n=1 Tax=Solanum commersonii TaxID=4109 RepID=A0A9J5XNW9_SOLCO|nr:hypothetical protein H5410_039705 [Solanum commersonii]